jgi:hypothetical protein
MRTPLSAQQSHWLRSMGQRKEDESPESPSLLALPNSPALAETLSPLSSLLISPRHRLRLLESLNPDDLFDEISAPEVNLHVRQAFQIVNPVDPREVADIPALPSSPASEDKEQEAKELSWTHLHVLAWFAWRFRPRVYLEFDAPLGPSVATVALSSPQTALMSFVSKRQLSLSRAQMASVIRHLARRGSFQPLTLVQGDGNPDPGRFLRRGLLSNGAGQSSRRGLDLIFVDGSAAGPYTYRALKNVFARCALGGLVVFRSQPRSKGTLPGQYCPRLFGFWERLPLRFPGFHYLKAPAGIEIGLAFRTA